MDLAYNYHEMILITIEELLNRYNQDLNYHFIDSKIDITTGKNFYPINSVEEKYRDKDIIYSWIQGRGLEAMVGHYYYIEKSNLIEDSKKKYLLKNIKTLVSEVVIAMEEIRNKNHGRLGFCHNINGDSLKVIDFDKLIKNTEIMPQDISNFSDIFYFKGLIQASKLLNDNTLYNEAKNLYLITMKNISQDKFKSDQQSFDCKNKVQLETGKFSHGPRMISLGGLAELIKLEPDNDIFCYYAENFINYILDNHMNISQYNNLEKYDFFEFIDRDKKAYFDNNSLVLDPGHALEFIGLACKCLWNLRKNNKKQYLVTKCLNIFPKLFLHILNLGFNHQAHGICKTFDLVKKEPLNSDMPWWSLPETMRAAGFLIAFNVENKNLISEKLNILSHSFSNYFINEKVYKMAYQTRNSKGEVISVIPATPDADPGYHTNLSIIDLLML